MKKRAIFFMDGNAFTHFLKHKYGREDYKDFKYTEFAQFLVEKFGVEEELIRLYYYCALPNRDFGRSK